MGRRGEGRDRGQDMVAKEHKMQEITGGELKWDTPYRVDVKEELGTNAAFSAFWFHYPSFRSLNCLVRGVTPSHEATSTSTLLIIYEIKPQNTKTDKYHRTRIQACAYTVNMYLLSGWD